MRTHQKSLKMYFLTGLIAALLIGCGAKPGEFKQTAGEMKEGPGVFTGKERNNFV